MPRLRVLCLVYCVCFDLVMTALGCWLILFVPLCLGWFIGAHSHSLVDVAISGDLNIACASHDGPIHSADEEECATHNISNKGANVHSNACLAHLAATVGELGNKAQVGNEHGH